MKLIGLFIILCLTTVACVPSAAGPPTIHAIEKGNGATTVAYTSAASRGAYFRTDGSGQMIICAENPPDIGLEGTFKLTNQIDLGKIFAQQTETPGDLAIKQIAELVQNATILTSRTQAIEAQRDALYRLCEMHANGALKNEAEIKQLYREILFTLRILSVLQVLQTADVKLSDDQFRALLERMVIDRSDLESGQGIPLND